MLGSHDLITMVRNKIKVLVSKILSQPNSVNEKNHAFSWTSPWRMQISP